MLPLVFPRRRTPELISLTFRRHAMEIQKRNTRRSDARVSRHRPCRQKELASNSIRGPAIRVARAPDLLRRLRAGCEAIAPWHARVRPGLFRRRGGRSRGCNLFREREFLREEGSESVVRLQSAGQDSPPRL